MAPSDESRQLVLPAVRGMMGDWTYYVAPVPLREVAARVEMADVIHKASSLNEVIQRALTARSHDIATYLLRHRDRLFNSLVIAVYGGAPQWLDIAIGENPYVEVPAEVQERIGVLVLSGTEKLIALDGQHRVAGIVEANESDRRLGNEQVSCMFVAHMNTTEGLERTRRLFTTLNRYAKAVSERDSIVQDEDDITALITRRLIEEHALLRDKTETMTQTRSLSPNDKTVFTSLVALYHMLDAYLQALHGMRPAHWKQYQRVRPSERSIARDYRSCLELWEIMARYFPPVKAAWVAEPGPTVAAGLRGRRGGHLLFRPIGLEIFGRALARLLGQGLSLRSAVRALSRVPSEVSEMPWIDLLWDGARSVMINTNKKLALEVYVYGAGGRLTPKRIARVREGVAAVRKIPPDKVVLKRYTKRRSAS